MDVYLEVPKSTNQTPFVNHKANNLWQIFLEPLSKYQLVTLNFGNMCHLTQFLHMLNHCFQFRFPLEVMEHFIRFQKCIPALVALIALSSNGGLRFVILSAILPET